MPNVLEHLKAKPESVRKRIAAIVTVVLTGTIVFVWFTILYTRSLHIDNVAEQPIVSSPLSIFFDEISGRWKTVQQNFETTQNTFTKKLNELGTFSSTTEENANF